MPDNGGDASSAQAGAGLSAAPAEAQAPHGDEQRRERNKPLHTTTPPGLTDMQLLALHAKHHDRLPMWTVYRRPRGYPEGYVARMILTLPPAAQRQPGYTRTYQPQQTGVAIFAPSLQAVRAALPGGLNKLGRFEADDPSIVETWL